MNAFKTVKNSKGESVTIDPVSILQGEKIDGAGYYQRTYNWTAIEGDEVNNETGEPTGQYVYAAYNNGDITDWAYRIDREKSLYDWLESWTDEFIEEFRAENLL